MFCWSDTELGWQPVVASWLQGRKQAEATLLQPCFDKYVDHMLQFTRSAITSEHHLRRDGMLYVTSEAWFEFFCMW